MKIERTRDMRLVRKILTSPAIWKTIGGNPTVKCVPSNRDGFIYLTSFIEGEPIGVLIVHPKGLHEYIVHMNLLPEYRKTYSKEFGKAAYNWILTNLDVKKLIAEIPFEYPNVKDYALSLGFTIDKYLPTNEWELCLDTSNT